jgi:hypothetical protein
MQIKILLGVRLGNVTFWMQTKENQTASNNFYPRYRFLQVKLKRKKNYFHFL